MVDFIEYQDVVQEVRGALNPGKLKLQSNSVMFKNMKTGKVDQYQSNDIEKVTWLKRARGHCLKILLCTGIIHRYDGLKESEFDKLSSFVSKYYSTSLRKEDLSIKGWNWGVAKFHGNALNFEVGKNLAFELPLTNVSHTQTTKSEVTLEFHQNDDASVSLMELRFHIPPDTSGERDPVQEFYQNVLSKADIIQATGDALVTFQEVQCLTPRGRYDIKIYPSFLQLHGKTFDYKIPYRTVLRLFLLPHKDGRQMFFVVSLDPPIKQGQTRYHFLILLFTKDDEMSVEIAMSEEDLEKKYEGRLTKEMSGAEYEVISRIFKAVVNRKITVPGGFVGHKGDQAIGCSYKAATGLLYPLERGFIFVHKPPVHIRFDEISFVNFARSAGSTRSFDFDIETKSGTVYTFVGIEKDDYGKLYDFVANKKLRVKNKSGPKLDIPQYEDMMDSDMENEGEHDAYLEMVKQEGRDRDDDDDVSDSSDESFNPGDSGSEVAEEYDSNPQTTSESGSEGSDEGLEKKPKEKKEKRKSAKTVPEGGKEKKRRRSKKQRDPDRPKRALSAYFLWLNDHREKIKEDNPGISITELTKKAAEMWKDVSDKTKWEKQAEDAKKEYSIAMEEYKEKIKGRGGPAEDSKATKMSKSPRKSPKKSEGKTFSGSDYKSKEFISSSEDSSSEEDKPLKKKSKKEEKKKTPAKKKPAKVEEMEEDGLPEDEEILSTPSASGESNDSEENYDDDDDDDE